MNTDAVNHADIPLLNTPKQSVVWLQREVQRGPTADDPTLHASYVVRRFQVAVYDFYRNRPVQKERTDAAI